LKTFKNDPIVKDYDYFLESKLKESFEKSPLI